MAYTKIDKDKLENTRIEKQIIHKDDLLAEKESLEKRLAEINEMLDILK